MKQDLKNILLDYLLKGFYIMAIEALHQTDEWRKIIFHFLGQSDVDFVNSYTVALLVSYDVNRFELRNRNRSTIPIILCTLVILQELDTNVKILLYIDG